MTPCVSASPFSQVLLMAFFLDSPPHHSFVSIFKFIDRGTTCTFHSNVKQLAAMEASPSQ